MESVKNLCGEQIAPDESIEHRLGQPVPQQGIDDFLPNSVGVVDPGGQHRLRRLAAIRPQVQVRTGGGIRPGPLPQVPQRLQALGLVLIVGVQKGDIGPPDMVKAHIPGLAEPSVQPSSTSSSSQSEKVCRRTLSTQSLRNFSA